MTTRTIYHTRRRQLLKFCRFWTCTMRQHTARREWAAAHQAADYLREFQTMLLRLRANRAAILAHN